MDEQERADLEKEAQHFTQRTDLAGRLSRGVLVLLQDLRQAESEIATLQERAEQIRLLDSLDATARSEGW